ncbi:MAG TPA: SMP-30/gluconolactonase/LRE family protein [Candidatus Binatia bacterium]|nr:SMP-30/gluconolactonase/LRE family protein [Candidatus Binatia bacterium]
MESRWIGLVVFLLFTGIFFSLAPTPQYVPDLGGSSAWGDDDDKLPFRRNATVTTLITTPRLVEGLTGDNHGNLYTFARGTPPCPVWQINLHNPSLTPVGFVVPAGGGCRSEGIAFNETGNLFVADGDGTIYTFSPSAKNPPIATIFTSGVPGANGIAFDKKGNLWVSDGSTGRGRVWKIAPGGGVCEDTANPYRGCEEVFRIQPMANEVNLVNGVGGVGRDVRLLPQGTITVTPTSRNAANTEGSRPTVANGLAFDTDGDILFIADQARGAIWKATFDRRGYLKSKTGCDTTFTPNTLCLDNVFVAHPYLEGADGIALDRGGNIWVVSDERQAIVVVTKKAKVFEVFRNPVNSAGLRNSADPAVGNNHILEGPASPFITGKVFCSTQFDLGRRDNSPRREGKIHGGAAQDGPIPLSKIACMDQELKIPGLRLPID